jgi:chemotaxis signal transduction protein
MRPFIQFSSRNIQKSNEYYLAFNIDDDCFAANFPKIAGFSKEFSFEAYTGNVNFIDGVATINNEQIPVINIKKKLGLVSETSTAISKLVIAETEVFGIMLKFAVSYDVLGDAFEIPERRMLPVPNIGKQFESGKIKGVHVHENNTIYILNLDRIFDIDDLIDIKVAFTHKQPKELVL